MGFFYVKKLKNNKMKLKGEMIEYTHECFKKGMSVTGVVSMLQMKDWTKGSRYMEVKKEVLKELDRFQKIRIQKEKDKIKEEKEIKMLIKMMM